MSWKLALVGVYNNSDKKRRYNNQSTIIDAIESLMKCREDIEHKGYIILFDFGIGDGIIFTRIENAIHYALITSYMTDYDGKIMSEIFRIYKDDCNKWGGTLCVWCLKPIEKLKGDLNNSDAFIVYEPYVEDWPYSEGVPGEVGVITINGVNYHIRHDREYPVAKFCYEKV